MRMLDDSVKKKKKWENWDKEGDKMGVSREKIDLLPREIISSCNPWWTYFDKYLGQHILFFSLSLLKYLYIIYYTRLIVI